MPLTGDAKRAYQLAWINKRRDEWIKENGPCQVCGTWDDLQVDHKDHTQKKINPARLWSLARNNPVRITELKKCQVLCGSCHRDKTSFQDIKAQHGGPMFYKYYKCRCDKCREWKRLDDKKYRG